MEKKLLQVKVDESTYYYLKMLADYHHVRLGKVIDNLMREYIDADEHSLFKED